MDEAVYTEAQIWSLAQWAFGTGFLIALMCMLIAGNVLGWWV